MGEAFTKGRAMNRRRIALILYALGSLCFLAGTLLSWGDE